MKSIIYSLTLTALIFFTTSCQEYLNTPNQSKMASNIIFADPTLTEGVVMGIYDGFGLDRSYRNRLVMYMGVNTDIELHSGSADVTPSVIDRKAMATYQLSPSMVDGFNDASGRDPWSIMYLMIERANLAIDGIRTYGDLSDEKMKYLLGESLTLRAYLYNDLIRFWGEVPARFSPITSETLYTPTSDKNVIYEQILADLKEAEDLVPWADETDKTKTVERVNKGFIKGLTARIALAYAGKSLRAKGVVDYNVDATKRTELYSLARTQCLDVINSGRHKLTSSFEQIFRDQCAGNVSTGRDQMFEIPFSSNRGQLLMYLGLKRRNGAASKVSIENIKGEVAVVPSFFYDYEVQDTRRNVTVYPVSYDNDTAKVEQISSFILSKWRAEWMASNPIPAGTTDDGMNFTIMRYADVLLMFAEAENELNGPTSAAKTVLKDVRARAFQSNAYNTHVETYVENLTTKEMFFNAIVDERAFEFAGECVRKWDLMRWGLLKTKMDQAIQNCKDLLNGVGNYPSSEINPSLYWYKSANKEEVIIYGLNRGEILDKKSEDPTKWQKRSEWIQSVNSETGEYRLSDIYNNLYRQNPDNNQVFPVMNIILNNSNGTITNKFY